MIICYCRKVSTFFLSQYPTLVGGDCELGRSEFRGVPVAESNLSGQSGTRQLRQRIEHRKQAGHRQFRAAIDPDINPYLPGIGEILNIRWVWTGWHKSWKWLVKNVPYLRKSWTYKKNMYPKSAPWVHVIGNAYPISPFWVHIIR